MAQQPIGKGQAKSVRERSTIEFPYGDLNDAIDVAKKIGNSFGYHCTRDQLAAALGHDNVQSGAFQMKLATAKTFGLVEIVKGEIGLTQLGRHIIDPLTADKAKAEAFLQVPLYRQIYENYRGFQLPPDKGLEQDIATLGVTQKQVDKARQAFQRSADQAGFFGMGRDRLIMPSLPRTPETKPLVPKGDQPEKPPHQGSGGDSGDSQLHPFIRGLLQALPPPGEAWPSEKRKTWLQTAENIFALIYEQE